MHSCCLLLCLPRQCRVWEVDPWEEVLLHRPLWVEWGCHQCRLSACHQWAVATEMLQNSSYGKRKSNSCVLVGSETLGDTNISFSVAEFEGRLLHRSFPFLFFHVFNGLKRCIRNNFSVIGVWICSVIFFW